MSPALALAIPDPVPLLIEQAPKLGIEAVGACASPLVATLDIIAIEAPV